MYSIYTFQEEKTLFKGPIVAKLVFEINYESIEPGPMVLGFVIFLSV